MSQPFDWKFQIPTTKMFDLTVDPSLLSFVFQFVFDSKCHSINWHRKLSTTAQAKIDFEQNNFEKFSYSIKSTNLLQKN